MNHGLDPMKEKGKTSKREFMGGVWVLRAPHSKVKGRGVAAGDQLHVLTCM